MISLVDVVNQKLLFLSKRVKDAEYMRDTAQTPTESHSDQTRQNAEQLIYGLKDEVKRQRQLLTKLGRFVPVIYSIRTPTGLKNFLIVPDGVGGQTVDETYLLAESTPLAKLIVGQKIGHNFTFNQANYEIVFIHKNS